MTTVVTDNCRGCRFTDCVAVCPVEAFHMDDEMLYINPDVFINLLYQKINTNLKLLNFRTSYLVENLLQTEVNNLNTTFLKCLRCFTYKL